MHLTRHALGLAALTTCLLLSPLAAQQPAEDEILFDWREGPGTVPIGDDLAEIDVPADYVYLDAEGTRQLMEFFGNPLSGQEMATLSPADEEAEWFLVFEYDDSGYVRDDENELDADVLLRSIREGTEQANEERRRRGWATLDIVGWQQEPHYDNATQNLTWSIIGQSNGEQNINRIIKLLGRRGVMTATLLASPADLSMASPATDSLLAGYRYRPGSTYAEFVPGDKVAEYGLTALVVGGAGAALVKSGLLGRFWKLLVAGALALAAGLRRFFGRQRPVHEQQAG